MNRKERFEKVIAYFQEAMPQPNPELKFSSPYELICAVVLSAQCTDKRVNMVSPQLFAAYPDVQALSSADPSDVKRIIASISYPNSKAEHLVEMARGIVEKHGGEVPSEIEELMKLSGVGRKTANVVASIIYDKPVIAVDTHVFRLSHRLGLSEGKTPDAVEKDLERYIPENLRAKAHHWLILHGRYICTSRAPRCAECALKPYCKYFTSQTAL